MFVELFDGLVARFLPSAQLPHFFAQAPESRGYYNGDLSDGILVVNFQPSALSASYWSFHCRKQNCEQRCYFTDNKRAYNSLKFEGPGPLSTSQ